MKCLKQVGERAERLLYDPNLRERHPIKYGVATALASYFVLGVTVPEHQSAVAQELDLPENIFTNYASVGTAGHYGVYVAMYFGAVEMSDRIQSMSDFLNGFPVDKLALIYGLTFGGLSLLRLGVSTLTKKPQLPYNLPGLATAYGIKGLEVMVRSTGERENSASLEDSIGHMILMKQLSH